MGQKTFLRWFLQKRKKYYTSQLEELREITVRNPYMPYPVRIDNITVETEDKNLKTFRFVFLDPQDEEKFGYHSGQFAELSVTGKGEIPIGIASSQSDQ